MEKTKTKRTFIILDNIRSANNVGSIFRTADASGVEKIFLIGTTPTPLDRFGRPRRDISKVSLGAEKTVLWQYSKTITPIIKKLKKESFIVVAVEQDKKSKDYRKPISKNKKVFVFGNEVKGISKSVLKKCDEIVEIPMLGKKESLNVAVAVGIILFSI